MLRIWLSMQGNFVPSPLDALFGLGIFLAIVIIPALIILWLKDRRGRTGRIVRVILGVTSILFGLSIGVFGLISLADGGTGRSDGTLVIGVFAVPIALISVGVYWITQRSRRPFDDDDWYG